MGMYKLAVRRMAWKLEEHNDDMNDDAMNDIDASIELLDIIARKFGYDGIQLWQKRGSNNELMTYAVFCSLANYAIVLADKEIIYVNCAEYGSKPSNNFRYAELVKILYKTLEGNGTISNGVESLDASMVPEFMLGCVLNGYV